ncbi:MAG: hypothetical protein WC876_02675 [Candidatus Thermoplasmatota archaeon]|jgi:hypothetical protein
MVRFAAAILVLGTAFFLSGCASGSDGTSSSTSPTSGPDPCPTVDATSGYGNWVGHGGLWGSVDSMEGHDDVVCGKATGAVQSLVSPDGTFSDLEVRVSFNMLAGDFGLDESELDSADAGAGLVIHFTDEENFIIIRYSPREQGWHLFTVIDGNREKQRDASVEPPTTNPEYHQWVKLRVFSVQGHVTAYDGTTKVIDYELPAEASHQGAVGYFLRDNGMVSLFDDFSAAVPA